MDINPKRISEADRRQWRSQDPETTTQWVWRERTIRLLCALDEAERKVREAQEWFRDASPEINGAIVMASIHGSKYTGGEAPHWMQELALTPEAPK